MPPTFQNASLNRYTPVFRGTPEIDLVSIVCPPNPLKSEVMPILSPRKGCFQVLNRLKESIFPPNGRLSPIASHTFLESSDTQPSFGLSGNHSSASYETSEFCWQIALNFQQHLRPCHNDIISLVNPFQKINGQGPMEHLHSNTAGKTLAGFLTGLDL